MAFRAVTDLIVGRVRGNRPVPPGFYRFRSDLEASLRGSLFDASRTQSTDDDDLIDTAEAAEILNCSHRWVRQIHNDLEGRNYGGRWVFRRKTVVEYAEMRDREYSPE